MIEFTQDKCDLLNNYSVGESKSWHQFKRGENGLVLRAKLNISIVFKAGELRKQELSLKHLKHLCLLRKLCPTNLNEDEPDDLPFN
jgi:hypothetical protein